MTELPNDAVLGKLAADMYKGENAVDYWEVAARISACAQSAKRERLMWTKTPPTEPGHYWARPTWGSGLGDRAPIIVMLIPEIASQPPFKKTGNLAAYSPGLLHVKVEMFDLWAGPIEAPPLPEEK